ncbi:MAG: phosphatase PAP2 family protein [Bacteroidota bacterium]
MLDWLLTVDEKLFLIIQGGGSPHLDVLMIALSNKFIWIPMYLLIAIQYYKKFQKESIILLLFLIVFIGLSDFITSRIMKEFFERLRPCHESKIISKLVNIQVCGGLYGFPSSHASNTCCLAFFTQQTFKNKWSALLLIWALSVCYSRIYLGAHYPLDVLVGSIIGILLACFALLATLKLSQKITAN